MPVNYYSIFIIPQYTKYNSKIEIVFLDIIQIEVYP